MCVWTRYDSTAPTSSGSISDLCLALNLKVALEEWQLYTLERASMFPIPFPPNKKHYSSQDCEPGRIHQRGANERITGTAKHADEAR